jgi:hypothetical protein
MGKQRADNRRAQEWLSRVSRGEERVRGRLFGRCGVCGGAFGPGAAVEWDHKTPRGQTVLREHPGEPPERQAALAKRHMVSYHVHRPAPASFVEMVAAAADEIVGEGAAARWGGCRPLHRECHARGFSLDDE